MRTLAIIGIGLIGGSIALAARARGVVTRIVGVGRSKKHNFKSGMLDEWHGEIGPAIASADAIVVCTAVNQIVGHVIETAEAVPPATLITDVGSTKAAIVNDLVSKLPKGTCFVGGHPLAGSEKSGPEAADADLFDGRVVVLTPHEHFHPSAADRAMEFWQALGARVKLMPAAEHDAAVATTSHLPHLLAATLASMLPAELRELAATGFRDTTRIAGGDPELWQAIFEQNQGPIAQVLAEFRARLSRCLGPDYDDLNMSEVYSLLTHGKRNRDALGS